MSNLNASSASEILKTFYMPTMNKLYNTQTILWDRVKKNKKWNVEGKSFTLGVQFGRQAQAGSGRASNGASLPAVSTNQYKQSVVPAAYLYTPIEIEGPIMKLAASNAGSFVRAIRSEVEGATEAFSKSLNRQANGDGRDAMGYVYADYTGVSPVIVDAVGNHNSYLQPGVSTSVDAIDVSDGAALNSAITATLGADGTNGFACTLGTSTVFSAGDYLVLAGTKGYQMTGLRAIINASDPATYGLQQYLQGLDVATYPWWAAQVVGSFSSLQDLRLILFQNVISKLAKNTPNGKDDIKFILTSYAGQDKYFEVAQDSRIAVNTMVLDGGYEGLEYNGIPVVADPEHWDKCYDFVIPDNLKICQVSDIEWAEENGNMFQRVSGKDSYEAFQFGYMNLGTQARNGLGALVGINM